MPLKPTSKAAEAKKPSQFEVRDGKFLYAGEFLLGEWDHGVFVPSLRLLESPLRAQQPAVEFVRQYDLQRVPKAVMEWLEARTDKMLVFQPGQFKSFSTSRSSSSWGNPPGGSTVGEFRVVVCQPSPTSRAEPARMLFDYVRITDA